MILKIFKTKVIKGILNATIKQYFPFSSQPSSSSSWKCIFCCNILDSYGNFNQITACRMNEWLPTCIVISLFIERILPEELGLFDVSFLIYFSFCNFKFYNEQDKYRNAKYLETHFLIFANLSDLLCNIVRI